MGFDRERYGQLLAELQPGIIESPEEHERHLTVAEQLMEKGDDLTPEEERVLALLVLLIEAYETSSEEEDEDEPAEPPKPYETLRRLLEARGLTAADITDIFGNPAAAADVLEGKRQISRGQAKQLANYFRVPAKLFQP